MNAAQAAGTLTSGMLNELMCPLDHPALSAQAAGGLDAAAGDARHYLPAMPTESGASASSTASRI
ncbi:hypothetical protein GCM10023100_08450 [Actinocorallia cavernae]|uniref:Uncharacterized protein n=2 Tax=Actinomycetes TaxID=1760 RepID=A0ABN3LQ14_9ACTN